MTTTSPPKPTPTTVVVGIDIGCETTKVVLGTKHSCEIVRSQTGMHTFPTAVSFDQKLRFVGETANQKSKNGILHLNRLLQLNGGEKKEEEGSGLLEDFYSFRHSTNDDDGVTTNVTVEYNGEEKTFTASQILAMFLGNIQTSVQSTIKRLENGSTTSTENDGSDIQYVITVEPNTPPSVHAQLLDAAYAAGLGESGVQIVESSAAYACCYQRKFPEFGASATKEGEEKEGDAGNNKVVLIVDMGHGQTSVSVIQFSGSSSDTPPEGEEATPTTPTNMTILSSKSSQSLGAGTVDVRLYNHFQSALANKLGDGVQTKSSRAGYRLLQGCHKLKHLLSQLPDGKVTVETIGKNDTDIALSLTREKLVELCQQDATTLQQLIQSTLDEAKVQTLDAVEVVGGGCRIPYVQTTIQEVLASYSSNGSSGGPLSLSRSLDDTSAALGAALAGENQGKQLLVTIPESTDADQERRQQMRADELKMVELDTEEQVKADCRNQMEALILELRSAKHGKHGSLLPSDNTLDDYLNTTEDWLFSEEADDSNRTDMEQKLQDVQTKTQELCASYYKALAEEQALKDKEMEEAAAQALLEKNGQPDGEEDDHDNRRLPKKRRMEIVMKNKSEANELFKDGNYRFAAARYTKALTHCAKFVDLNPDDIKEVTELKVTLNLNLALAYSKLSNLDQCLRVCNEAINLDDASLKAYYRRASVYYEKKQWDNAKTDIVKAKKLPGGDTDKAIQKLSDRIDLQLKKQKQKEKKMASKMFG